MTVGVRASWPVAANMAGRCWAAFTPVHPETLFTEAVFADNGPQFLDGNFGQVWARTDDVRLVIVEAPNLAR